MSPDAQVRGRGRVFRAAAEAAKVAKDESGYVMIVVLAMLVIGLGLGAAGLAASLSSRSSDTHTAGIARAQQAADAGIRSQLYQQAENTIGNAKSSYDLNGGIAGGLNGGAPLLDCLAPALGIPQVGLGVQITGLTQVAVNGSFACPASTSGGSPSTTFPVQALGHKTYAESEFIPGASTPIAGSSELNLAPKIVSLGWTGSSTPTDSGNLRSREVAILAPIAPLPVLGANGSLTVSGVTVSGGLLGPLLSLLGLSSLATTVNGDVEAAKDLTLPTIDAGLNLTLSNGLLGVARYGERSRPPTASPSPRRCTVPPPPIRP